MVIEEDLEPFRILLETLIRRQSQLSCLRVSLNQYLGEIIDDLAATIAQRQELESVLNDFLDSGG